MADSPNLRRLARQLAALEGEMQQVKRSLTTEQMKYSSVDDGAILEKDEHGSIVSRWGRQHDGTHGSFTLDGPVPPVPEAPVLEGENGALTVTWDGLLTGDRRVPMDFQTVQIGLTDTQDGDLRMVGVITSEAGGSKTLSTKPGTYWVALRTRAQSGRASAWSERTSVEVEPIGVDPEVIERLEGAFTTSEDPPTPEDGQNKPDGAYWTQIDTDGAQIARWRWDGTQWADAPLSVEFIPEAYVDFLAANSGFISELESEIIRSDTFQGREFIGGTFTGTRFEGAEVDGAEITGGSLDIEGALTANSEDGVRIGGAIPFYQHLEVQTFPGSTTVAALTSNSIPPGEDIIIRVKIERTSSYQYGGRLEMVATTFSGLVAEIDDIPLIGEGEVREYRVRSLRGARSTLRFRRHPVDSDLGTPAGEIEFSELEILTPSTGDVTVSGQVSARHATFESINVSEPAPTGTVRMAAGNTAVPADGSDVAHLWVTFPEGRFRPGTSPTVTASVRQTRFYYAYIQNISHEGCQLTVHRYDGGTFTFNNTVMWQAVAAG